MLVYLLRNRVALSWPRHNIRARNWQEFESRVRGNGADPGDSSSCDC
jgi:hypothetical protein